MKFKIDKNFKTVCELGSKPAATVAQELCDAFVKAGVLTDNEENFGRWFISVAGDVSMLTILDALTAYFGVDNIRPEVWDALCKSYVIGPGNCPFCGGNLTFLEEQGHENGGTYYIPPDYVTDYYVYECALCGSIIKSKKELYEAN